MSLREDLSAQRAARFPRVSGDEPIGGDLIADRITFSPRERG